MKHVIDPAGLSSERRATLHSLSRAPAVAWRTVLLLVATIAVNLGVAVLAITGRLPYWMASILIGVGGYLLFSVVHDAIHRAVSTREPFNDWVGRIAAGVLAPYVSLGLFRWCHVQHHRFANGDGDPDLWFRGSPLVLVARCMTIDVAYLIFVSRRGDRIARGHLRTTLKMMAVFAVAAAVIVAAGWGRELLFLWFIPSRITQLLLGLVFFWLPHIPHDTRQQDDFTRATTIRLGHEWLFSPLLQWQNFHLLHHLYPTTPFYNNAKLWHLLEPELRRRTLAVQNGFALEPEIVPPGTQASASHGLAGGAA